MNSYFIGVLASLTVEVLMTFVQKDKTSTVNFQRFIKHAFIITLFILVV